MAFTSCNWKSKDSRKTTRRSSDSSSSKIRSTNPTYDGVDDQNSSEIKLSEYPSTGFSKSMAETLDGRLICASQCAYEINSKDPYFRGVGYIDGTKAKRISRSINSAFVGRTVDGVVVSFRGTLKTSALDWIQNAAIFLSGVSEIPRGKVHGGFYGAVKSLWRPLTEEILAALKLSDKKDLYFTGHSKGGAMASIAALLFELDKSLPKVTSVSTFASIKFADSDFRDFYNSKIKQTTYESFLDIIPFLPPSASTMETMKNYGMDDMMNELLWTKNSGRRRKNYAWDYQVVGNRRYINEMGTVETTVTKDLDDMRIRDIEKSRDLKAFSAAHCSSCPNDENGCFGSYFRAIANEVCEKKTA